MAPTLELILQLKEKTTTLIEKEIYLFVYKEYVMKTRSLLIYLLDTPALPMIVGFLKTPLYMKNYQHIVEVILLQNKFN